MTSQGEGRQTLNKILIHSTFGANNVLFDPDPMDGTRDAAILLRQELKRRGYRLETADDHTVEDCAWVFFYDAPSVRPYGGWRGPDRWVRDRLAGRRRPRNLYQECRRAGLERLALFLWEPPSTTPENWNPRLHDRFPLVFTWHDGLVDGKKYHKIHYPQLRRFPEVPDTPFSQKKLLINISANKISFHPQQLYSARRAGIRHFERSCPDDFDLYGYGWDHLPIGLLRELWPFPVRRYPSYRGTVPRKWDVMPGYRFSLCYENIRDEPGYVTEKIFDSMRCGCVPIYWGASNITDYVNGEAFVDRRQFGSDQELEDHISGVTEVEYGRYQEAIQAYLHSERFAAFLPPTFVDTVISVLDL